MTNFEIAVLAVRGHWFSSISSYNHFISIYYDIVVTHQQALLSSRKPCAYAFADWNITLIFSKLSF
jgi:hypothetical protein